jgi:hypothetical protein
MANTLMNIYPFTFGEHIPGILAGTVFWSAPYCRVIFHVPRSPTDPTQGYKLAYQPVGDFSPIGALPSAALISAILFFCPAGVAVHGFIWGLATVTWLCGRPWRQVRKSESWAAWLGFKKLPRRTVSDLKDLTRLEEMYAWACVAFWAAAELAR